MINKYVGWLCAIVLILLSHLYTIFYFPPSEGWWQTYGYLYNRGFKLYQDIDLAFPPLFVIFNAALMKLSPYYMFYRIVGLIQVFAIFFFMYLSVRKKYSFIVSISASVIGILMSVYNIVYFPNDYHTSVSLFAIATIYYYIDLNDYSMSVYRRLVSGLLMSLFLVGTFLLKQNIGFVLLLAILVGYTVSLFKKRGRVEVYLYFVLVVSTMLIFIVFTKHLGMDFLDFIELTAKNDSKGNIVTVVTRVLVDDYNRGFLVKGLLYFPISLFYPRLKETLREYNSQFYRFFSVFVFVLFSLVFFRDPQKTSIIIVVIFLYVLTYRSFFMKEYSVLLLPLLSLFYANSMTAGLCVGGVFLIIPFAFGFLFDELLSDDIKVSQEYFYYSFLLFLFLSLFVYKQKSPYNWWGLEQASVSQAKYTLPYEELKFFRVDKSTSVLFSDIKKVIDEKSRYENDVYLYPDIPVFYQLHKKVPLTKNIVQWYDVINTDNMRKELEKVKSVRPRLIIMLDSPWFVYKGHASLKQSKLVQPELRTYLDEQVRNGVYRLLKYQIYDNNIFGDNENEEDVFQMILVVRSLDIVGKTIDDLYDNGALTQNYNIQNIVSRSYYIKDIKGHRLRMGDKIIVNIKGSQVNDLVCKVGEPDIIDNEKYVLKIFELVEPQ